MGVITLKLLRTNLFQLNKIIYRDRKHKKFSIELIWDIEVFWVSIT